MRAVAQRHGRACSVVLFGILLSAGACGGSRADDADDSVGGSPASGGAVATGGSSATGGSVSGTGGGLATAGTGGSGGAASGGAPGVGGGACSGWRTADGRGFCDVRADYEVRCDGAVRADSLADCRASSAEARIDCAFVTPWAACLDPLPCDADMEDCAGDAILAFDPTLVDPVGYALCLETGDCSNVAAGLLADCFERFSLCSSDEDLCANAVFLLPEYRAEIPGCFTLPCEQLAPCVAALTGASI